MNQSYNNIAGYQQQQPQLQRSFMMAPSEAYAYNYPVAIGNSVLFQDVNDPTRFYEKAQGFSSFERPAFRRMRMIIDEDQGQVQPQQAAPTNGTQYVTQAEYEELRAAYAKLSDKMEAVIKSINLFTEKEETDV